MPESFDPFQFVHHLRSRWRFLALVCGVASALALVGSWALTKLYTATARIVIDPPAGSDLRAAMAVSPIYLESLRTYERFAESDSVFVQALEKFKLRAPGERTPVESLKRRVLKVAIVRNTKVLEISATLEDPVKAQMLARFLAEETVKLNRNVNKQEDDELVAEAERQFAESRTKLDAEEAIFAQAIAKEPAEGLSGEIDSLKSVFTRLRRRLAELEEDAAEPAGDSAARVAFVRKQSEDLEREIAAKRALLAASEVRRDQIRGRRNAARLAYDAAEKRLREVMGAAGYRGERLKIIDPGIVPERPSFPSTSLNVMVAFLLALALSLLWVTLEFGFGRPQAESKRAALRIAGKSHDV